MYLTKYLTKIVRKFKMQSKAKIYFFGMRNDHTRQAKREWRILNPDIGKRVFGCSPHLYGLRLINYRAL